MLQQIRLIIINMMVKHVVPVFVILTTIVTNVVSYGEYVPKSVFLVDENGQKFNEFQVRSKRDLESALKRYKRYAGNGQSGASSYSFSHSSNDESAHTPNFQSFIPNLDDIQKTVEGFSGNIHSRSSFGASTDEDLGYKGSGAAKGKGSAQSPHGAFSSSRSSGDDQGNFQSFIPNLDNIQKNIEELSGNIHSRSSFGASTEKDLGYKGPILFSRSGATKGKGVKVSGSAQGPNGAFSSSRSSVDDQGNVKYEVKSGKY